MEESEHFAGGSGQLARGLPNGQPQLEVAPPQKRYAQLHRAYSSSTIVLHCGLTHSTPWDHSCYALS